MSKNKRLALLSMCACLAMILSFAESRIPPLTAVPGIKMGLANIAVMFTLYKLGTREAAVVSAVRVILIALLFGSLVSFLYSFAGAVLSFSVMLLLRKIKLFSVLGVSVAGGVCHNIGQITMACILLETNVIVYYLPFLLLSGTVTGVLIGAASALLINRIKIK